MKLKLEKLNKTHIKNEFECGKALLTNYIRTQASQDVNRDLSACFVLANEENNVVTGYYTLTSSSIERDSFPSEIVEKLPQSYISLPTILIGRLAVDSKYQGNGIGKMLLMHALNKCLEISKDLGILAIIVDPIDDEAVKFYEGYGFIFLPGTGKMFLPLKTIKNLSK